MVAYPHIDQGLFGLLVHTSIASVSCLHPSTYETTHCCKAQDLSKTYFFPMLLIFSIMLPMVVPMYFWGETWSNAFHVAVMFRLILVLHITFLVNSAAHYWGTSPYDKFISAKDNLAVGVLAMGEGWHNYHHTFPWDYKAAELGNYRANFTTGFIDFFAKIGWAYDLKTASPSLIQKRTLRTGDKVQNNSHAEVMWGWGDKDMQKEDIDDGLDVQKKES